MGQTQLAAWGSFHTDQPPQAKSWVRVLERGSGGTNGDVPFITVTWLVPTSKQVPLSFFIHLTCTDKVCFMH